MDIVGFKIANEALAFYEVGKREYFASVDKAAVDSETCFYRLIPAIVNLAFSIELSFKAGINEQDAKKCGHDLQKLFDKIGSPINSVLMNATVEQMKRYDATYNESAFLEQLSRNKNAFENWRQMCIRDRLTDMTREANKRFFSSIDEVPTAAVTMGVGTVMACLLYTSRCV